jgi:hypothetical protein
MRLPRMTIRRRIVVVAVVGIGLTVLSRWTPRREEGRICVDLFPIEPPRLSGLADPYDADLPPLPPPASPRVER